MREGKKGAKGQQAARQKIIKKTAIAILHL